jgi:hypothetical protein
VEEEVEDRVEDYWGEENYMNEKSYPEVTNPLLFPLQ